MMFEIKVGIRFYICSDNGVEINYFELEGSVVDENSNKGRNGIYLWKKIMEDKY